MGARPLSILAENGFSACCLVGRQWHKLGGCSGNEWVDVVFRHRALNPCLNLSRGAPFSAPCLDPVALEGIGNAVVDWAIVAAGERSHDLTREVLVDCRPRGVCQPPLVGCENDRDREHAKRCTGQLCDHR